jgi:hypothetical protein
MKKKKCIHVLRKTLLGEFLPRVYLRLIWRTGWLWIYTSRTTDGCPFKPRKLSVPFLCFGVPAGLTPFRGLGQRNLVPILPPAHPQKIKPRSRVERLPPSSHVKELSVTAHYEHYAHDEWSIGDLLHWLNYPFLPITLVPFLCFGVPAGLTPFRGLGQRNLVPILPPAHPQKVLKKFPQQSFS